MNFRKLILSFSMLLPGCQSSPRFEKTADSVDTKQYMGKWYVIASRPTFFEKDGFNATETYTFDEKSKKIDVLFRMNKNTPTGPQKEYSQTAEVFNAQTQAHWKISIWWIPFKFDYLILDIDPQYRWTAVGVPNQKYLWIMSREPMMSDSELQMILQRVAAKGYAIHEIERVIHSP